jgi:hypothetical protein
MGKLKNNISILFILALVFGVSSVKLLLNFNSHIDHIVFLHESAAYKAGAYFAMFVRISLGFAYILLFLNQVIIKTKKA